MEARPIVVVGSLNFDLVAYVERLAAPGETLPGLEFESHPGGKGANQAAAVARLGYPVYMMGRVGSDAFGAELRNSLERAGVDTTYISTSSGSSGVALIAVSSDGEDSIIVVPGANALFGPEDLDSNLELIRGASLVLTQLEIPFATVDHLAEICEEAGVPLILDPAPARPLPRELLRRAAWITPNEVEARQLSGRDVSANDEDALRSLAEHLIKQGPANVLLKLGERGSYLAMQGGCRTVIPACAVRAVDTTGAGDSFNGAFAVALARGATPTEAAKFASAASALSVTRRGAQSSMPTQAEVNAFLDGGPELRMELTGVRKEEP